jgi:hypothetical protein
VTLDVKNPHPDTDRFCGMICPWIIVNMHFPYYRTGGEEQKGSEKELRGLHDHGWF